MNSTLYDAIALTALIIACMGAFAGFIAITLVIGLKNSTHQIVWKPVEQPKEKFDPFDIEDEDQNLGENPNKRQTKKINDEEDFADLDNPEVSSNFN